MKLLAVLFLSSWIPVCALSAQTAPETLDRLVHLPGTSTGEAGIAHVERRGKGTVPLVLIAGAPFGWKAWESFMARNEERYRMFALTPAGYGGTKPPAMPDGEAVDYTKRAWTEAVMSALAELIEKEIVGAKLGLAVVVGHHLMGDYYAVRLAYERPELVRAVVSVAGSASQWFGQGQPTLEERAAYVKNVRVPFFRTVPQSTWNANTFQASTLSRDAERGRRLYEEEIGVPLATQIRYYLEYLTDDLDQGIAFLQAPVLVLTVPSGIDIDAMLARLPQTQRDAIVQRYGSLEAAKREMTASSSPWPTLANKAPEGLVRIEAIADTGLFVMEDRPEEFERALGAFLLEKQNAEPASSPR